MIYIVAILAGAGLIYAIWNWLIAAAFDLPTVTFLQALAINVVLAMIQGLFSR